MFECLRKMWNSLLLLCIFQSVASTEIVNKNKKLFELSVLHLNDFHARFEETSPTSSRCINDDCVGGFSRLFTAVNSLIKDRPNAIFLNAGDNFQGTLWYNLFGWNVTQYFLNKLPTDAYTLGNHEFDNGIAGVVPFIKALKAPVVVSNIDDSNEPDMQGLYNKSTVIVRAGRKIGIIGVILSSTNQISKTEKLKFTDEILAVNTEAEKLVKNENCSIIIVLSHCGIEVDKKIAENAGSHIGLIVGGHTHTFLYTGPDLPGPEKPKGPYPVVVKNKNDGRNVLVVQAASNTRYLGNLSVWYDDSGKVVSWTGNPIYLDKKIAQDPIINNELNEWKSVVNEYGNTVLGTSKVLLDQSTRRNGESNIGSFYADAMVDHYVKMAENTSWTFASIAILNSGAIRASIYPGNITVNDLVTSQPFDNTVDCVELEGKYIKDFLEYSITPSVVSKYQFHEFLQVSGLRVVFDANQPVGSRVTRLKVRCNQCLTPTYSNLNQSATYRLVIPSFLANGGDGYSVISDNIKNRMIGPKELDVYSNYIKKLSIITQGLDERVILNDFNDGDDCSYSASSNVSSSFFIMFMVHCIGVFYR